MFEMGVFACVQSVLATIILPEDNFATDLFSGALESVDSVV